MRPTRACCTATTSLLALALAGISGCGEDGGAVVCRVDGDCASGHCRADGSCGDYQLADGQADAGVGFGDAAAGDGAPGDAAATDTGVADTAGADAVSGDAGSGDAAPTDGATVDAKADAGTAGFLCQPNHDDRVERKELHFAHGLKAPFRIAKDVTFDPVAKPGPGGALVWNLLGPFSGDATHEVATLPPSTAWYAADVPGATYAVQLAVDSPLLGVFEATGDALLLRAVVSPDDGLLRTRLLYDPPAQVLALPLEKGKSFSTVSTVKGEKDGVFALWTETWSSQVDTVGIVQTPYGNFPALRVRTTLTRKVGLFEFVTRSFAFVAECYGTVASLRSELDEGAIEFTKVDELRRLALP